MKKLGAIVAGAALAAFAAACTTDTTNTNAVSENRTVTTNTTTSTNTNTNVNATAANANTNTRRTYNANISEEEYSKDKERYGQEAKQGGETIGAGLKDGWLWVKVKGALATVDDLRDSTINVDLNDAVATLRGTVASAAQKTKAEQTAKGVSGIKSVKNELKVDPNAGVIVNSNNANANTANHNAANHNK
ncbi:MAG TPA: BON domain-containing protein [Pyrinomonadaceae bacterium]|jgi:osmotically-inducible protein OsmY